MPAHARPTAPPALRPTAVAASDLKPVAPLTQAKQALPAAGQGAPRTTKLHRATFAFTEDQLIALEKIRLHLLMQQQRVDKGELVRHAIDLLIKTYDGL